MERVGAAFAVPAGAFGERVRRVLELIDGVHRAPPLPRISVAASPRTFGVDGWYGYGRDGRPSGIVLDPASAALEVAFLHEVGHALDHQALGRPGRFASVKDSTLREWRTAAFNSAAAHVLRDARREADLNQLPTHDFDYLLNPRELWARSYAQFIALHSNHPILAQQMLATRLDPYPYNRAYWRDDDFAPIAATIAALFRQEGWQ